MLRTGDDIDSWCGVCKLILAHTIEAIAADTPARVHCNTCKAQHKYRPHKPSKNAKNGSQRKARTSSYEKRLNGKDMSRAKRYSPRDIYVLDDVVEHPSFGVGVTTTIKDGNKIEVVFENGMKTLIHGR